MTVVRAVREGARRGRAEYLAGLVAAVCDRAGGAGLPASVAVRLLLPPHAPAGKAPIVEQVEAFGGPLAELCESLQWRLRDGPRVLAERDRSPVLVPDLRAETRWPVFRASAVTRYGLRAVHVEVLSGPGASVAGTLSWYGQDELRFCDPTAVEARRACAAAFACFLPEVTRGAAFPSPRTCGDGE